jgi:hypothetical protein
MQRMLFLLYPTELPPHTNSLETQSRALKLHLEVALRLWRNRQDSNLRDGEVLFVSNGAQ